MSEDPSIKRTVVSRNDRKEFLLHMYDQLFSDINTHILVVWQSIGVLTGTVVLFALVEKQILSHDVASGLVVLIAAWLVAHVYDASYWYNRNLAIISNIERQFMWSSDREIIHYYFGRHREDSKMLSHLRLQWWFGIVIGIGNLCIHAFQRVPELLSTPLEIGMIVPFTIPYLLLLGALVSLWKFRQRRILAYQAFKKNSPGAEVDTTGVQFGIGHPIE